MTDLDRRELFSAAMAAAGLAATSSSWLDRWLRPQDPADSTRVRQLREAAAKARREGKPLLVFVAPGEGDEGRTEAYERSNWFGAFLNHGGPTALLEVALCVPAVAAVDEVCRVTGAKAIDGLPMLLIVDATQFGAEDAAPPKVTRLDVELGSPREFLEGLGIDLESQVANRHHVEQGIAKLKSGLHEALHRHGLTLTAMADAVVARFDDAQRTAVAAWAEGGDVDDALVVRATAELRRRLGAMPDDERAVTQRRLVDAIEREVVRRPVPGARWFTSMGCGMEPENPTPEDKDRPMIACGMAAMPAHCDRFLWLYTDR